MSSYEELLRKGRQELSAKNIPDGDLDAWYLLEYLLGCDRNWYLLHGKEEASEKLVHKYKQLLEKRGNHVPLQQITGAAYFMGLQFFVNENVLIPRQDTEILVEEALKRLGKEKNILDLCTGTGCVLLSILYNRGNCTGTGVDVSTEALAVAEENQRRLGLKAKWVQSDLFSQVEGRFDMIVSNPPYIPSQEIEGLMEEVRDHEPHLALDGGVDGLDFYRRIVQEAAGYLTEGGWLLMETGYNQGEDLQTLLDAAGYREIEVVQDLAGLNRVIVGRKYREEIHV